MIDFSTRQPLFYWTFDSFEDLKQERKKQGFDDSIWKRNAIASCAIGVDFVTFDSPEEWGENLPPVKFERSSDGSYQHRSEALVYEGVRADTESHVVLTGRWSEADYGKGVFIAVFPVSNQVG
jgi:hypothetical protein